jgi:hypothetical protein
MTVSWAFCPPWFAWQAAFLGLKQKFRFFAKIVSENIRKFHDLAKILAKISAEIKSPQKVITFKTKAVRENICFRETFRNNKFFRENLS